EFTRHRRRRNGDARSHVWSHGRRLPSEALGLVDLWHFYDGPAYCQLLCSAALPVKNRLKVLRAENDWSQAQLADRIGVARQTIVAIETGKYGPSLALAFKFSKLFGKPVEEIFDPET